VSDTDTSTATWSDVAFEVARALVEKARCCPVHSSSPPASKELGASDTDNVILP
jgi:hypothetical protein